MRARPAPRPRALGETKPFIKQEHKAKIGSVFVSPKARGLGAGRALIKAIIEN
ncbi:GNAT family N-acetyltransferase, partial [Bacillus sp. D-CC]